MIYFCKARKQVLQPYRLYVTSLLLLANFWYWNMCGTSTRKTCFRSSYCCKSLWTSAHGIWSRGSVWKRVSAMCVTAAGRKSAWNKIFRSGGQIPVRRKPLPTVRMSVALVSALPNNCEFPCVKTDPASYFLCMTQATGLDDWQFQKWKPVCKLLETKQLDAMLLHITNRL